MGRDFDRDRREPPDGTAPMGRYDDDDATRVRPGGDFVETRVRPGGTPDGTRVMPPIADEPGEPRWEARASVPPAGTVRPATGYLDYEEAVPPPDDRNWLRPLLFGVIGLVLLVVLLTGVWLIFTADDEPPAPQATASAAPTAPATTAPPATNAPPTSASPELETVRVPQGLVGITEDEARQRITDAGLRVQVTRREDATMAPGTVLEVSPGPGSDVEPNSVVRIVVAAEPRPGASSSRSDDGNG